MVFIASLKQENKTHYRVDFKSYSEISAAKLVQKLLAVEAYSFSFIRLNQTGERNRYELYNKQTLCTNSSHACK